MLHQLIGKKTMHSLMSNAASELALACDRNDEQAVKDSFSKVCAYGMDMGIEPTQDSVKTVVKEVFDKMCPEQKQALAETVSKKVEEVKKDEGLE